jgi:hypothetical protein
VLLLYRGGQPGYALWLAVPMMWLAARLIRELTVNFAPIILTYDGFRMAEDDDTYWWLKWLLAIVVLALLIMLSVHWLEVGRGLMDFPQENPFAALSEPRFATFKSSAIWFIISLMFITVGYFLAASIWGNINSLQGFGLGFVLFMLGTGVGMGWNTAVFNATNPYELWHTTTITDDAYLLRTTLFEVADRNTKGFPLIPLMILRDEEAGITDDSIIAWLVRDFQNARFVDTIQDVQHDEIILLPEYEEDPDLGGSYVGQSFLIRQDWSLRNLRFLDMASWLSQRRVKSPDMQQNSTVLWLRIDVYDGIPAVDRIRG